MDGKGMGPLRMYLPSSAERKAGTYQQEGRYVPAFLLEPHEEGHVPPHLALSALTKALCKSNPSSASLSLVSEDRFGMTRSVFEPNHPQHLPPHMLAFMMYMEL